MPVAKGIRALLRRRRLRLERAMARDVTALLDGEAIALLDVGASGGIIPRWYPHRANIAFTGIEPDQRSIPGLLNSPDARAFRAYEIIPSGAWNVAGPVSISFTRKPMCSSHFSPNRPFLSRFPDVERFDLVGSSEIVCQTVDGMFAGSSKTVDFIKLDLEGGELAVLEGAATTIGSCLGLHVEAWFQPIRDEQPLFGDIAGFLRRQGVEFVDFVSLFRWRRDSNDGLSGQAIFADALFLRSPESVAAPADGMPLGTRTAKVYLGILTVYERFDLALKFLELLGSHADVLGPGELKRLTGIIGRRKAHFDRRRRASDFIARAFTHYAGPNQSLHQLY